MEEKKIDIVKNNKCWYSLLCICIITFIFILLNVLNGKISVFDNNIYSMVSYMKTDFVTSIFKIITEFGDAKALISISLIILIVVKNKKIGVATSLNLVSIALLNYVLKNIIQRPRPEGYRLIEETGYSFPSGHSMASLAFYGLIIYFILKNLKNKKAKIIISIILSILVLSIGISRIYLGVHYASDVIAGFLISIAYLVLYISIILKYIGIEE